MAVSACFIALLPSLLADSASGFIVGFLMAFCLFYSIAPFFVVGGFCLWFIVSFLNGGFCLFCSITPLRCWILPLGSLLVF
jgi:hypothetical protein